MATAGDGDSIARRGGFPVANEPRTLRLPSDRQGGVAVAEEGRESGSRARPGRAVLPSPAMGVALLALFVALGGSALAVSRVGTKQIRNQAVTTAKIKPGAVKASRLAAQSVSGPKIAAGAVGSSKIAASAITSSRLADGAVTGSKIAFDSVGAANLLPGSVGFEALADSAVQGAKIAPNAIQSGLLADQAVTGPKLAPDAVASQVLVEIGTPATLDPGAAQVVTAACPAGKTAISAGFDATSEAIRVYQLYVTGATAFVGAVNPAGSSGPAQVLARAVCI